MTRKLNMGPNVCRWFCKLIFMFFCCFFSRLVCYFIEFNSFLISSLPSPYLMGTNQKAISSSSSSYFHSSSPRFFFPLFFIHFVLLLLIPLYFCLLVFSFSFFVIFPPFQYVVIFVKSFFFSKTHYLSFLFFFLSALFYVYL